MTDPDTSVLPLPAERVALQLYTVRSLTQDDFVGTLRRVAAVGYRAVEFAGFGGLAAADLRRELDALGLAVAGAHVSLPLWEENPEAVVADLQTLGAPYGVVPWVPEERRGSVVAAQRLAADLARWGEACRAGGLGFAYHHHNFEFAPLPDDPDRTLFDVIVADSDPALVKIEFDVYWAAVAEQDPAALLRRLAGRVPLVHLKDTAAELGPQGFPADAPAGAGTLPWDAILAAAAAAGAEWYVAEQDNPNPNDPLADAEAAWHWATGAAGSTA